MKWNKLYEYPKSIRSLINDSRHYDIGEEKLPSVTTILAATQSDEKRASLAKWKQKVGENEAERVKNVAASRGTAMHTYLEHHIEGQGILDLTEIGQEAQRMANTIIDKGLTDLSEIWGSEVTLYYPGLYAGATDIVGIYQDRQSIVDFKQTNKPKKREWIEDYCVQLAAYTMAHNYVYKTNIQKGVIMMCSKDNFYQEFEIKGLEMRKYMHEFLKKVNQFYEEQKEKD